MLSSQSRDDLIYLSVVVVLLRRIDLSRYFVTFFCIKLCKQDYFYASFVSLIFECVYHKIMNRPTNLAFKLLIIFMIVNGLNGYVIDNKKFSSDYWRDRAKIINDEEDLMIGGDLTFHDGERLANDILMEAKWKEIDDGCQNPSEFLPAHSFLLSAKKIRESQVFKIIENMPKGAVLHAHDTAITSAEYIFWNITYRPNLYVCDVEGLLKLKFFDKPDKDCEWKLLEHIRKTDKDKGIDHRIAKQLTMITQNPDKAYPNGDVAWQKFVSIFMFITPMLTYRPVYEDHFYRGLLEFYNDNVLYLELRTTLPTLYELDGTEYGPIEVARIYKKVTERFIKDHPDFIGVKLIYAPIRKCNDSELDEFLSTARQLKQELNSFIAGFDLVGQEDKGEPLVKFAVKLRELGDDVQLFFHAGETNWYGTSTDENLIDAVMLNTKRIGHGYALLKHPKVMEMVRKKGIAIEVSPISNQVLNLVKDLRNHPASLLFAENYPVIISNDDPGLWGAQGLSYDFYQAFVGIMSRNADLRALKKLAMNSFAYSSLSESEKQRALEIWNRRWEIFIQKIVPKK